MQATRTQRVCEIIYSKDHKGWKWRELGDDGRPAERSSEKTFELFYDCVAAARARGYAPNVKCP